MQPKILKGQLTQTLTKPHKTVEKLCLNERYELCSGCILVWFWSQHKLRAQIEISAHMRQTLIILVAAQRCRTQTLLHIVVCHCVCSACGKAAGGDVT